MITKKEIVEILCNHGGYMDRSRTEQGIHEDNFQDVADDILSKLSQHDVSSRRELLKAFLDFYNSRKNRDERICYDEVEVYIESL